MIQSAAVHGMQDAMHQAFKYFLPPSPSKWAIIFLLTPALCNLRVYLH